MILYFFLRVIEWVISRLSYRTLHALGRVAGILIYYVHTSFRKKTLTNIAIAFGKTKSEKERRKIAKRSFQNLTITCLEFFRLKKSKENFSEIAVLKECEEVISLLNKGQGVVCLSAHQANWEIPFVAITQFISGIAIGRPIKNKRLYEWVLSVREMNGGKIVMPKTAIKLGMEALKEGKMLGIVGDQAFPTSSYSYPLFGTRAWTATTPAVLAYRTNSPLVVGSTKRVKNHYEITASPLLWPDTTKPLKEEVQRMMNAAMAYLEASIAERPWEWLWQHDRWKQQGIDHVKRKYRFGFILVILPPDLTSYLPLLPLLRDIFPRGFFSFLVPLGTTLDFPESEIYFYATEQELKRRDFRYQLVLDFYGSKKARRYYKSLGAFQTLSLKKMRRYSPPNADLKTVVRQALVKPECL